MNTYVHDSVSTWARQTLISILLEKLHANPRIRAVQVWESEIFDEAIERGQLPACMPDWLFDIYSDRLFEEICSLLESDTLSICDSKFEIDAEKLNYFNNLEPKEELN